MHCHWCQSEDCARERGPKTYAEITANNVPDRRYYRPDIDDNIDRIVNAMRFYMHLHAWKGSVYDATGYEDLEGVERNYYEFLDAVIPLNAREVLAEGIGLINHTWMAIVKLAEEELEGVQDWQNALSELIERENESA